MKITSIPYQETGFYSSLIGDYLAKKEKVNSFYNHFPTLENFELQILEKQQNYNQMNREVVANVLEQQYQHIAISSQTKQHIQVLKNQNTFTVVTGHQLNLFTGPLYFLYKIISTINLCEQLSKKYPNHNFVPVYWMATEDHDFEEINYFNFDGKKVQWHTDQKGAVGKFTTDGLQDVFDVLAQHLGSSKNATFLKDLFSKSYLQSHNLADATRILVNELFGDYGLVIIDANHKELKALATTYFESEIIFQNSFKAVTNTNQELAKNYTIQVNPREINLFYLGDNYRERIVFEKGMYQVLNTNLKFTEDEILQELRNYPEKFSPNVLVRPLYQEVVLPNLCYIGGAGELAYWLQLKAYFDLENVTFPLLLMRNSVQIVTEKQEKKLHKLTISLVELFTNQKELIDLKVKENTEINIQFDEKINYLKSEFNALKNVASKTDASFINAVKAQEKKQIKGLENLKKRLLKAEKKRQSDFVERIITLQNEILPHQKLEERQRNFSTYYLEYGKDFINQLKKELNPLEGTFTIAVFS